MKTSNPADFEQEAVNGDGLTVIETALMGLGAHNLQVLYFHLEKMGIRKNDIILRPIEFAYSLRLMFGQGSAIIEKLIINAISSYTKCLGNNNKPEVNFVQAIERLREFGLVPESRDSARLAR